MVIYIFENPVWYFWNCHESLERPALLSIMNSPHKNPWTPLEHHAHMETRVQSRGASTGTPLCREARVSETSNDQKLYIGFILILKVWNIIEERKNCTQIFRKNNLIVLRKWTKNKYFELKNKLFYWQFYLRFFPQ